MTKKFKTRVCYFGRDRYTVQYAYYKWFPLWKSLKFWFEQSVIGGTECWSTNLFSVEKAEELASSLKSIRDVEAYYKPYIEEREDFYRRKKEYYKKNVPYQTKTFNHE